MLDDNQSDTIRLKSAAVCQHETVQMRTDAGADATEIFWGATLSNWE